MIQSPLSSNGYRIEDADFVEVRNGIETLLAREIVDALGISVTHTLNFTEVSMVNNITAQGPVKHRTGKLIPTWPFKNTIF